MRYVRMHMIFKISFAFIFTGSSPFRFYATGHGITKVIETRTYHVTI